MKRIHNIFIFILLILGMSIFPYIPAEIFNIDINSLSSSTKILYEFSCDIGFMIIIYTLYHKDINNNFKDYFKNFKNNFKISLLYYIIGFIIMIISNNLISTYFTSASANNEDAVRSLIDSYPKYMLFSVGIYAPFVEELIFRKSIKDIILPKNKITNYLYIFISGFIFASLHVVGMVESSYDLLYIIPYLALGISFAALYSKTDNIFSTIVMHSMHNIIAIIVYWMGV